MTPEQEVVESLNNIERAYQSLKRAAGYLTQQFSMGGVRCVDLRRYNLLMMSVFNAQAGYLELMSGAGVQGLPKAPPFPMLFAVKGVPGEASLDIDCGSLPLVVGPNEIRIITGDDAFYDDNPEAKQQFSRFSVPDNGELGWITAVLIVVGIVVVATAVTISVIASNRRDQALAYENTKVRQVQSDAFERDQKNRLNAMQKCTLSGGDPVECANVIAKLPTLPEAFYKGQPVMNEGLGGSLGKIALIGAAAVVGLAVVYQFRKKDAKKIAAAKAAKAEKSASKKAQVIAKAETQRLKLVKK